MSAAGCRTPQAATRRAAGGRSGAAGCLRRQAATRRAAARRQGGFVTVQFVAAVALSLLLFVQLANLLVWSYGRGVVRAALDEGVRAGARSGPAECERRARELLDDLLGGAMGAEVGPVRCGEAAGLAEAQAAVRFRGWLPAVPDWSSRLRAVAVTKPAP